MPQGRNGGSLRPVRDIVIAYPAVEAPGGR